MKSESELILAAHRQQMGKCEWCDTLEILKAINNRTEMICEECYEESNECIRCGNIIPEYEGESCEFCKREVGRK